MSFDADKFLKQASTKPGVYQMLDNKENVIYVGKAKNLKARLASYFRHNVSPKTQLLVSQLADIQVIITSTETEALLLEHTLVKQYLPRYNILLRDDKSYPYLYFSEHAKFPSLTTYRGAKRRKGDYFGPYVNVRAMYDALELIQKLFKIRPCRDSFFNNRSRPCLQYQIKRCKAPCVNLVTPEEYQQDVQHAKLFLQGKSQQVVAALAKKMEQASQDLHYEQAGQYRDLIAHIRQVQQRQFVVNQTGDVDVIATASDAQRTCVAKLIFRNGQLLGNKWYYPKNPSAASAEEVVSAFISQHYLDADNLPKEIVIAEAIEDQELIAQFLSQKADRKIVLTVPKRGNRKEWLHLAISNAQQGLAIENAEQANLQQQLSQLQQLLNLDSAIECIECFDISHTHGDDTVASCVVFGKEGPVKSHYRRFNIKDITRSDDYAAMRQALLRRYTRLQQDAARLPDVLVIDGGKGQIKQAVEVLQELQITNVTILGIAKGSSRKPGLETLILADENQVLSADNFPAALTLLQFIRDEAHRFAITGHRGRRGKKTTISSLENIEGVGPTKRRELLRRFGGMQQLHHASVAELAQTPGINQKLAERIHVALHPE